MPMPENPTTKDKLMFAGIKVFARHGYKGATVRQICQEAGTANATAVNYYFGSKEKLYHAILEVMFAENARRREVQGQVLIDPAIDPVTRLRMALEMIIDVGFGTGPLAKDFTALLLRELMSPSQFLYEMVDTYVTQDDAVLRSIIRDFLGPEAPEEVVRDSMVSVAGQLFYYMAFWPVFSRIHPEHPGVSQYKEPLVEHIMRFSLAGLEAVRQGLDNSTEP
ncbi:MAG: TetR/AcrR family transcriptional regulator [Desulfovibrio sp.]|nr:MAG: TetR/AcrR family transcriptional regulator [Desulfovibrio sp.]